MSALVHFFGMAPADYWGLTLAERNALVSYMNDYAKAQKDEMAKARRRR
ncbi:MAG: hypothetical protein M3O70_21620 [Actinomycetota bacterium]|nr:hypothetical protein [Actinomycetota bacterium]